MTPPNPFRSILTALRIRDLPRRSTGIVVAHDTDPATGERLSALGLGLGAVFTVLKAGEMATVRVGESRIGLGPELSCAIRALPR